MWTAFPPSDYYADSATPRAHRPASGLAGRPPAARRARGASHVRHDPFDRVGSWLYPYSPSDGHSQHPVGHHARTEPPDAERAAVKQGGIVAVSDPCPPGFGSLEKSRGFYHHFAFALPFGLASTHAGVWQCRPAVALSGRLTSDARSRASAVPSFSGPLHQPGAGIPAGTDEMFDVRHLLSHGASWRRFTFLGYAFRGRGARSRNGRIFNGFLPAISPEALKAKSVDLRRMRIHRRTDLSLDDLARWLNPIVSGWINYYGRFYRTALDPLLKRVNVYLRRWAGRKYKRLRTHKRFSRWWTGLLSRQPGLFAHWRLARSYQC